MNHKVGIWIDHKKAVIVSASGDRITAETLESDVGPLCSAKSMQPSRGLRRPAILVMQPIENRRRDYSTSREEVIVAGGQPVSRG